MLNRLGVLVLVVGLAACGDDGGGAPTAPPTPVPTPTPANYSGTYTGNMLVNLFGQAETTARAQVTVSHSGNTITYGDALRLTLPGATTATQFPLGSAAYASDTANGAHSYTSAGCGTIGVQTIARFAGNLMNLTVVLNSPTCGTSRMVGELSR
jgi:hypothetical protein